MENNSMFFFKDTLLKSSSLIFIGMMIGHLLNYLFQITMGRMLTVQTFGEMNALLSTLAILGVPFVSITNYIAKNVSRLSALGKDRQANDLIMKSYKIIIIAGLIIVLLGSLFSKNISEIFKIKSIIPILLLFLGIFISVVIPVNTGILQGFQNFKMLSFLSAGLSFFKYVLCVILVAIGLSLNGIMIGLILSLLIMGYVSFLPINGYLRAGRELINQGDMDSLSFIVPIVIANLSFTIITQGDVALVKYFFSPFDAGIYSSAAIIGKAVMYLPGAIIVSLFPMVASNIAKAEKTLPLILKALAVTLLLSGGCAILLYLFPEFIVSIFFGEKFVPAKPIIGLFAITALPMAIIMILMNYNLARGARYFAYIMLLCATIQTIGITIFHDSLIKILNVMLYSGLFCSFILFALMAIEYYRSKLYNLAASLTSRVFTR